MSISWINGKEKAKLDFTNTESAVRLSEDQMSKIDEYQKRFINKANPAHELFKEYMQNKKQEESKEQR